MSADLKVRCRAKLVEVAKRRDRIKYSDLAKHLGIANQGPWGMLHELYREEVKAGRPDVTLVVVYASTGYGKFNSEGGPAGSVKVDTNDPQQCQAYDKALEQVWGYWSRK